VTALLLVLLLGGAPAPASGAYEPKARAEYLDAALSAVKSTDPKTLDKARSTVASFSGSTCASQFLRLRLDCLVEASERWCRARPKSETAACPKVMDLAVDDFLAEEELVPRDRRLEIMRAPDYRKKMDAEVRSVEGEIAADFQLRTAHDGGDPALAARIDRYCLARADASELSWQSCAGALVWFIGTSTPKEH
jgi:hypothetical protein